jgi:hypothetical protein
MINFLRHSLASLLLVISVGGLAETRTLADAAGNYGGVIEPTPSDPPSNSGLIQLQLNATGFMSGVLIWQGQRYPFKGELTESKPFAKTFQKKLSSVSGEVSISLNLSASSLFIFGNLTDDTGGLIFSLPINLSGAPPDPVLMEKLRPGLRISFIDPPNPTTEGEEPLAAEPELGPTAAEIPGDGFVHVRISKSKKRASRLVGKLPDAQGVFTAGSPLRGTTYTVFSSLYRKLRRQGGQLFGNANVFDVGDQPPDFTSTLRWGKDPDLNSAYYPSAFNLFISLNAVPYPKLRRGSLVPLLPEPSPSPIAAAPFGIATEPTRSIDARILFRRGNISLPDGLGGMVRYFRQNIKMSPFSTRVVGENPYHVKIQVDAFSGRFHGSFIHPVLDAKTRFRGAFQAAVLLTPGQGRGHFRPPTGPRIIPLLEPLESGGVRINVN